MEPGKWVVLFFLVPVLLVAVIQDVRFQKIPNWLTLPFTGIAIIVYTVKEGFAGFQFSAGGAAVGIGVLLLPYILGGMGAGDAKLMGAVGGVLGPTGVFSAFLFTALTGGIYAIILMVRYGNLMLTVRRYGAMMKYLLLATQIHYLAPGESEKKPRLRYGVAIGLGTIFSVLWGEELLGLR